MTRSKPLLRGLLVVFLLAGLVGIAISPSFDSARAAPQQLGSTDIVISQVYGGGGNSGATFKNDFIELHNLSSSPVDVTGWSVQYAPATDNGSGWVQTNLSGTIDAGHYYLIQEAAGSGGTVDLPTPDVTGSIGMAAGSGKVALINNSTVLNIACPSGVVDFVGYGSNANCYEGTVGPAPAPSNTKADLRNNNGCYDTDNNNTDFTAGTPNPRNSSSPTTQCSYAPLSLVISEVAWAGTKASVYDEWIELYNPGTTGINLAGWKLEAADGDPSISLNPVTLNGGDFYLLERSDDRVTDVTEDQVYNGGLLSDSGETLYLLAPDRAIVDTANSTGGAWPAGGGPNFASMERVKDSGGIVPDGPFAWITNIGLYPTPTPPKEALDAASNPIYGTPKWANWAFSVTPTFTPTITPSLTPTFTSTPAASRDVLINEVAWMGTLASSSGEWIELYNPGAQPKDLSGWKLYATDGSPTINLTGMILAGGYFVLASSSSVFDDLTPQQTFSGS